MCRVIVDTGWHDEECLDSPIGFGAQKISI